jgi:beta-N-acetylhexosaminidase
MKQLIGQHMIIGISGHALTAEEKNFIVQNNISGVILFDRNISEPKQLRDLCNELQSLRHQTKDKAPLFIAIDMEGGRVSRLKAPFTQWPPLKFLGDLDSPTVSFNFAKAMGQELKAVGINLNLAPCIDIFSNPKNTVIGDRAISQDAELVAKHASGLIRGYVKSEVIPCAKHFPGHGNTTIDSHQDLPVEQADLERLNSFELVPFKKAFKSRLEMTMTAHIRFPKIDPEWPVTMSEIFLKKILREDMRFRGLIMTDDLDMKALTLHFDSKIIPVRSLQAGADLLLYCNDAESPAKALIDIEKALTDGQLKKSDLEQSYKRISQIKKDSLSNPDPIPWQDATHLIGHADHFKLSQAIANGEVPPGLVSMS